MLITNKHFANNNDMRSKFDTIWDKVCFVGFEMSYRTFVVSELVIETALGLDSAQTAHG